MNVLIAYPGHSVSTFDVAEGWYRALERLGHTVYQLNYEHNVPFYGAVCDYWVEKNPDFKATMRDVMWLASQDLVCKAIECLPLDFVLFVTGLLHHPRAFELMAKVGIRTVLLFTESPYNDEMLEELLPLPDVVFTNDRGSVKPFRTVNPNSFYMPHSYDPERHRPATEPLDEEYQHDVFFWGSMYDERRALFEALLEHDLGGAHLYIVGTVMDRKGGVRMAIENAELVKHYQGSKIVLSPNRTTADYHAGTQIEDGAYSLGPRVYEVAACGTLQITDTSRPELREVFGSTIPAYQSVEELARLIRLFINDPERRARRAAQIRKRVEPCTFDLRAETILFPILEEVSHGW